MFTIKRRRKVQMNFTGSPQCGNTGDMKFDISVAATGHDLDRNGFVFDSALLFELFHELEKGQWHGSCEGIGIFCARWLFQRDTTIEGVVTTIITQNGNELTIDLTLGNLSAYRAYAIQRP